MNDFTKEELQIILLDMNTYIRITKILKESPSHKDLRGKVESMIDNYCDDKYNGNHMYVLNKCATCG